MAGHALVHVDAAGARHGRGRSSAPSLARRFTARWHLAWSEGYVARKYALPEPSVAFLLRNALKALGYGMILRQDKMIAHAGSCAGAWAWRRGGTALERQGLSPAR